jgi:hypothetical protein
MKKLLITLFALGAGSVIAKDPNFNIKNKTSDNIIIKVAPQSLSESSMSSNDVPYKLNNTDKNKLVKKGKYTMGTPVRLQRDRSFSLELEAQGGIAGTWYDLDVTYIDKNSGPQTLHTGIELKPHGVFYIKTSEKGRRLTLAPQEGVFGKKILGKATPLWKTTEGYSLKNNVENINPNEISGTPFKDDAIINLE